MTRRALAVAGCVGACLATGTAGAVIGANVITLKLGDTAKLKGTHVTCFTSKALKGSISIECGKADSGGFAPGAYSAYVNDTGVSVYINNSAGNKFKLIHAYGNK